MPTELSKTKKKYWDQVMLSVFFLLTTVPYVRSHGIIIKNIIVFAEYAFLFYLAFRAFGLNFRQGTAFGGALAIAAATAIVDQGVKILMLGQPFNVKDILFCLLSSAVSFVVVKTAGKVRIL